MTNKIEKVITGGWFLTGAVTIGLCVWFEFIKNSYGAFMGETTIGLQTFIDRSIVYCQYLGAARVNAYYAVAITVIYGLVVLLIKTLSYYKTLEEA